MDKTLTFSQQVKEEIVSNNYESKDRLRALLAAFIRINGAVSFKGKKSTLLLLTENAKIAKFIYSTLKEIYNADCAFEYKKKSNFSKTRVYQITVKSMSDEILEDLEISFLEGKISKNIVRNDDTIAGYLAGAFLAAGSVNSPTSSNYHLEIAVNSDNFAKWILHLFNRYKNINITPKVTKRRDKYVIYFKKSDRIAEFLVLIGAVNSCMDFENIRIDRDFMNSANRLSNFDTANMKRTTETALKQLKEIQTIDEILGIKNIQNEKARLLARLRMENEYASMVELAEIMSEELGVVVSKSNINHLFRHLHEIYKRFNIDEHQ